MIKNLHLFIFFVLLPNLFYAQPCVNTIQFPVATQVIPTDGTKLTVATNTTNYYACNVLSGQVYFVYSQTGTDEVSVWGTSNGTGTLGNGVNYVFTSPTTGTTMWVDFNRNGACGGTALARTTAVELLPYNITIPIGVSCIGSTITITGNAFALVNLVTFTGGATAVPTAVNGTSFNVVVPAGAQSGPITLQTFDGWFTITNSPSSGSINIATATGVSFVPSGGGIGDIVTINGNNLLGSSNIAINGNLGTSVTVSNTQIVFTVAAGTTSGNVTFTDGCGNIVNAGVFTIVALTNYYSKATGNLNLTTSWGTATNGTGANPPNFTANGQRFNIRNNATPTIAANWTVSGTGSGVIVGDGVVACNFTVPSARRLVGNVLNVNSVATLTLLNSTVPTLSACICAPNSTVVFGMNASVTIPGINYGNLSIPGAAGRTYTFGGNSTIFGTLNISTTGTVRLNNTSNLRTFNINNFTMSAGTLDGGSANPASGSFTSIINVIGTFKKTAGTITNLSASGINNFVFNSSSLQNFSNSGTFIYNIVQISKNTNLVLNTPWVIEGITGTILTVDTGCTLTAGTNLISTTAIGDNYLINGKVQTANTTAFSGVVAATFVSTNSPTVTLGSASTVEYNSTFAQAVTSRSDYANIMFSNNSTKTASGVLTIAKNLTINTTATFNASSFSHNIAGNWTNNGTFTPSTGTVTFNGVVAQQIIGSSSTTFNNLTINNTYPANAITLIVPINVNGIFSLIDGHVITDITNVLTLSANASVVAPTSRPLQDSTFVKGPLINIIATTAPTTKYFPIGKNNISHYADLMLTQSAVTPTNYTGEFINSSATALGWTLPATITKVSDIGYWSIDKSAGSAVSNASVNLYFLDTYDKVTDPAFLNVAKGNSSAWLDLGGAIINDGFGFPIGINSSVNFTTFSKFSLANGVGGTNPLPINLLSFDATCDNNNVQLKWVTASEINNSYFTVEKSSDAKEFIPLSIVDGAGTTTNTTLYSLTDENAFDNGNVLYYRLKQTDYDGKSSTSEVIAVQCSQNIIDDFRIGTSTSEIIVYFAGNEGAKYNVFLFDNIGRIVSKNEMNILTSNIEYPINISSLPQGTYNLVVSSDSYVKSKQIFIIK